MPSIGRLFAEDRLILNNGVHIHLKLSVYLLNWLVLFCFVFQSTPLLITTFAAFGFMLLLAWFKYLIAYKVDSRALRTDGKSTLSHFLFLQMSKRGVSFPRIFDAVSVEWSIWATAHLPLP